MREILYRGINQETGKFVYGFYTKLLDGARITHNIIVEDEESEYRFTQFYIHRKDTIGQYIGLTDKNGTKIFEGDKFEDIDADDESAHFVIEYCEVKARFVAMLYGYSEYINEGGGEEYSNHITALDDCVLDIEDLLDQAIIGNIHEVDK